MKAAKIGLYTATFLLAIAAHGLHAESKNPITGRIWLQVLTSWQSPLPQVGLIEKQASAKLIYFKDDGDFFLIGCSLIDQKNVLTISSGDGQITYAGKWKKQGKNIEVRYQVATMDIARVDVASTDSKQAIKSKVIFRNAEVLFDGHLYFETKRLNAKDMAWIRNLKFDEKVSQ